MMQIPDGVQVEAKANEISVKGPRGQAKRLFRVKGLELRLSGKEIAVGTKDGIQLDLATVNTIEAHIRNLFNGVTLGYSRQLQMVFSHFPINLEVKGKELLIKNFLGEKQNRTANIIGSTKIEIKGANVSVSGPDNEEVGQTVANIRTAMRIRDRDSRIFQDGLYPVD